ncbi:MAG: bifunctional riboflavin kinase/FAD synthetase [Syntrophomonadaceae bacterium]|jgi:riboflavin kinase/FMN adenylyltransferase
MRIVREIEKYNSSKEPLYLALGNFDGLHRGHQQLMREAVKQAGCNGGLAAAFIFEPHPVKVLFPQKDFKLLVAGEMKSELLEALGLDLVIYNSFSREIAGWTPEEFVKRVLVDSLAVKAVFVGFNHSFGHKGAGTPLMLQELGNRYGFKTYIIPPVKYHDKVISSTLIRQAIEAGDIELANHMLGYYFVVEGQVIAGEKRGREMGFPTANLGIHPDLVTPGKGVYAAWGQVGEKMIKAVVNIGSKPTFHPDYPVVIEAHLLDWAGDLYGGRLRLHFTRKLRDERKFNGLDELAQQIARDRNQASELLDECRPSGPAFTF